MGTLKIEIDLPEFEKELNLNITIKRDGEVICTSSSTPEVVSKRETMEVSNLGEEKEVPKKKPIKKTVGGNMMGLEI